MSAPSHRGVICAAIRNCTEYRSERRIIARIRWDADVRQYLSIGADSHRVGGEVEDRLLLLVNR